MAAKEHNEIMLQEHYKLEENRAENVQLIPGPQSSSFFHSFSFTDLAEILRILFPLRG